jgi:hypothetical protein
MSIVCLQFALNVDEHFHKTTLESTGLPPSRGADAIVLCKR